MTIDAEHARRDLGRRGRATLAVLATLCVLLVLVGAVPALAYVFEVTDGGDPIFWPSLRDEPPGPIQFVYNERGSTLLGGPLSVNGALKTALDDAITRWEGVSSATVRFRPSVTSSRTAVTNDGVNLVVFTSTNPQDFTGPDGPFIVGLTTTSFIPSTGVMMDADMQFNDTSTNFRLSLNERTGTSGATQSINLRDVVTHESGHALGLDHSGLKNSTMYFAASDGATNLSPDDIAGISLLYPAAGYRSGVGTISGRVSRNGNGVFGAHVVAIDVTTGQPTVAAVTLSDGRYKIEGVPPGRYAVMAEALRPNALGSFYEAADTTLTTLFHGATSSSPPTIVVVRPTLEAANVDLRVEQARTDGPGGESFGNPIALTLGSTAARRLPPGSIARPADFYSFQATKGTTVTINITAHRTWVPVNAQLQVFDAGGTSVAGPSTDLDPASDLDDRLVFSPPGTGTQTYTLKVRTTNALSGTFPDTRSIKDGESLYLLTTQSVRSNHPPRFLTSAPLSNLTTIEAGIDRGGPISVDLSAITTDDEDPLATLSWVATNVPSELFTVDSNALNGQPPVLRIVPKPFRSGTGTFNLMVFDPDDKSATVAVHVTITPVNDPPKLKVDAGLQLVRGGPRSIQLDASASAGGPDGDTSESSQTISYAWSQLAGPLPVTSTGASAPLLKVLARDAGVYRFQLTGTEVGADALASTLTQDVTVDNLPPTARAVAPPVALPGQLVRVRADLSSDPNETLTTGAFALALVQPVPASVPTTREATATFAFNAPLTPGHYVFELSATDSGFLELSGHRSNRLTATSTFAIDVRGPEDLPPTADAGFDRVAAPGETILLDGRDSIGATGEALSYAWTVDAMSAPTPVALFNATEAQPSFQAPGTPGNYTFNLAVRGSRTGLTSPLATTHVRVLPVAGANRHAPVARPRALTGPGTTAAAPGDRVLLDGTPSGDPDGSLVSYAWTQVAGPTCPLSSATGSTPSFVPPTTGLYRFRLVVNDGQLDSRPATVDIPVRTTPAAPPRLILSARQPATGTPALDAPAELRFPVDGTAAATNQIELSARLEDGSPLRVVWEQTLGPRLVQDSSPSGTILLVTPRQARVHAFRATAILPDGQQLEQVVNLLADRASSRIPRAVLASAPALDVILGADVELDGTASRDLPPGESEQASSSMVYYWDQEDGPPVTLTQPLGARAVFTPPMSGRYAFRLRVDNQRFGTLSAPSANALVVEVRDKPTLPASVTADPVAAAGGHSGGCTAQHPGSAPSGVDLTAWLWCMTLALTARRRKSR